MISVPDAVHLLGKVNRVMVIGVSGGGKTTLALKVSERFGLAYQSLDRDARWLPGWKNEPGRNNVTSSQDLLQRRVG